MKRYVIIERWGYPYIVTDEQGDALFYTSPEEAQVDAKESARMVSLLIYTPQCGNSKTIPMKEVN